MNIRELLGYTDMIPDASRLNCVSRGCVNLHMKSCYALSLLRGLACVPRFQSWADQHANLKGCRAQDCVLCMVNDDLAKFSEEGHAFVPLITRYRGKWAQDWTRARQECSMEAFQKLCESCQKVDEGNLADWMQNGNPSSWLTMPSLALFGGLLESTLTCHFCNESSKKIEVMTHIQVNIPTGPEVTLDKALEKAQDWERLRKSTCPKCKRSVRKKRMLVQRWPSCLVVHIKRWHLGACGQRWVKKQDHIYFENQMTQGFTDYYLKAVVCHSGQATSGHYICYACPFGEWFRCDDTQVTQCTWEDVLKDQAYILFYDSC